MSLDDELKFLHSSFHRHNTAIELENRYREARRDDLSDREACKGRWRLRGNGASRRKLSRGVRRGYNAVSCKECVRVEHFGAPAYDFGMNEAKLLERISVDPKIFRGKPIIRGRRLAVEHVLGMLAAGDSAGTILESYPWLEADDIQACLLYARRLVAHERLEPMFVDSEK